MTGWEEFLMEVGDYAIIASAVITLVGVIFTLFKNNSLSKEAVDRTNAAENALSAGHTGLSAGLKELSAEHEQIKVQQALILERTADSKDAVRKLTDTLSDMDRRMIQADVDRNKQLLSLDAKQHQLVKSAEDIGEFAETFLKLAAEKSALESELTVARAEITALQKENKALRQELAQSQDREEEGELEQ